MFCSSVLLLVFFPTIRALQLDVLPNSQKCFTEDLPPNTILQAQFHKLSISTIPIDLQVTTTSHHQKVSSVSDLSQHIFTYKSPVASSRPTTIQFCLSSHHTPANRNGHARIQFDLKLNTNPSTNDNDDNQIATTKHVEVTSTKIRNVAERIDTLLKTIELIKITEKQIDAEIGSVAITLTIIGILTCLLMIASAISQLGAVEKFFKKKRFITS